MKRESIARFFGLMLVLAALVASGCASTGQSTGSGYRYQGGAGPTWQSISPPGT